jgi:3D (Asp-Asp-Asp) domain-containing protein
MQAHLILLGVLVVTSYRPVPEQTKPECQGRYRCETSTGENVSELGVAVSRDLLATHRVNYGDVVYIPTVGFRIVNDTMAIRHRNAVDVFVYTKAEERRFGVRHLKIYKLEVDK